MDKCPNCGFTFPCKCEVCAMCDGSGEYHGLTELLRTHGVYDSAHESMKETTCRCCGGKCYVT